MNFNQTNQALPNKQFYLLIAVLSLIDFFDLYLMIIVQKNLRFIFENKYKYFLFDPSVHPQFLVPRPELEPGSETEMRWHCLEEQY